MESRLRDAHGGTECDFQCQICTDIRGERERQCHRHVDRLQSKLNHSSDGYGDSYGWIADGVSLAHCNWQRSRRNQRILHRKSDCQRSECYGDGCEFE